MYAAHFGLHEPPFNNTPDPRFFRATTDHEEALACLIYVVQERKGFALLTGEVGAGKTLVARMMLRHFGDRIASAVITNTSLGADDLLAAICSEFGVETREAASRFDLVSALQDYLLAEFTADHPVVLVLDEAQNLSDESFEQVRMIGNLEADDAKLLQIVIVGQPELRRRFAAEHMCPLNQRLFRSVHLPALSREACGDYIRHRLAVARGSKEAGDSPADSVFDEQAVNAVFAFSRGLPRLINTVCDNAMLCAYAADRRVIDGLFVDEVAAQLAGARGSVTEDRGTATEDETGRRPAEEARPDGHSRPEPRESVANLAGPQAGDDQPSGTPADTQEPVEEDPADEPSPLEEASARAQASIHRVGRIYAAAEQTYRHLIHHLADIHRPTARITPSPEADSQGDPGAILPDLSPEQRGSPARRFRRLLEDSRSSLDTLRMLVRRTGGSTAVGPGPSRAEARRQKLPGDADAPKAGRPTSSETEDHQVEPSPAGRLVRGVNDLAEMASPASPPP